MHNYNMGKGVYIWEPRQIARGDPKKILERLQMAGVQSVVVKICDSVNVIRGLETVIDTLRSNGIRVEGWGYSYNRIDPLREAQAVADSVAKYNVGLYLIDVEIEAENNSINSERFIDRLRELLPNTALGLNTFWNVPGHPLFPWKEYLRRVDFVCPQMYWRREQPVEKLKFTQQTYKDVCARLGLKEVPMPLIAGDMYTENGIEPTPEQLVQFLDATQADASLQGILMWASDENETTPPLWKKFSAYPWRGVSIPKQPIGWGQVKVGLFVRSSPQGSKIGGLVKNQIVPIWHVQNGWASINPEKTEWVSIENENYISTEIDMVPTPPPPPGLYKAMVISGTGLKIREAPYGTQVGSLKYKQVVEIYEEKDGWARVDLDKNYWVNARYLKRI